MKKIDLLTVAAGTGAVVAGAALIEVALLPGLAIGAAAVLLPQLLPVSSLVGRRAGAASRSRPARASSLAASLMGMLPRKLGDLTHIKLSRSLAKTVTFRVIVTGLDFTGNYLILGNPATAAGLSAISVVGGPLFYFVHETGWNYLLNSGRLDPANVSGAGMQKFLANRPLVKTVTYRSFATLVEFTTNYVVVRDLGTAALLSSLGFFLGPFVYYGHELAWERAGRPSDGPRMKKRPPVIIDVEALPA